MEELPVIFEVAGKTLVVFIDKETAMDDEGPLTAKAGTITGVDGQLRKDTSLLCSHLQTV